MRKGRGWCHQGGAFLDETPGRRITWWEGLLVSGWGVDGVEGRRNSTRCTPILIYIYITIYPSFILYMV